MNFPADLKYTKDHEWIRVEGDVAYVGITDYAQGELGEIVYVDITTGGRPSLKKRCSVRLKLLRLFPIFSCRLAERFWK